MSDMSDGFDRSPAVRRSRFEYQVYFGIIFAASLPIAVAEQVLERTPLGGRAPGVVGRARRITNTVIPFIFSR